MAGRAGSIAPRPRLALEKRSATIRLTGDERDHLLAEARAAGATLAQQVRTCFGLEVRSTPFPTAERDGEEDDAWARLQRLGLNPQGYFVD